MKSILATLCFGAALASAASSEIPELKGTLGLGAGIGAQRYYGTFGDQGTPYGRLQVGYHPLEWLGGRAVVGYGDLSNDGQNRVKYETDWFSHAGLDVVLQPKVGAGAFRPYLSTGIATTFGSSTVNKKANQDLDWNFYAPVELGAEYLFTKELSAFVWVETYLHMEEYDRLDGVTRNKDSYFENRDDVQRVGLGLTWRIGLRKDADKDRIPDQLDKCPATPMGVKVDLVGCPLDADKDGVGDYLDKCASTPENVKVDSLGCPVDSDKDGVADFLDKCASTPAGVRVDGTGCPVDADKDGVADHLDKCPNTAAGTKVDAKGCPVLKDADKDGVEDAKDKCPGTKVGEKVDSTGCTLIVIEKGVKLVLDGIVFKSGSSRIDASSAPVLARAAAALAKAPTANVEIAGFTDNRGKSSSNLRLSKSRAEAVRTYLIKLGASPKQLTAVGYGASQPVADNSTAEGRAVNRRIEFRVK